MIKFDKMVDQDSFAHLNRPTVSDVRAKVATLQTQLSEDKLEAAAFAASPKAVLASLDSVLADMRQAPLCAQCTTTCGITSVCGFSRR